MNRSPSAVPRSRSSDVPSERPAAAFDADSQGETPALDGEELDRLRRHLAAWRAGPVAEASRKLPPRLARFSTCSDAEVPVLVTPADVAFDYDDALDRPGQDPLSPVV